MTTTLHPLIIIKVNHSAASSSASSGVIHIDTMFLYAVVDPGLFIAFWGAVKRISTAVLCFHAHRCCLLTLLVSVRKHTYNEERTKKKY